MKGRSLSNFIFEIEYLWIDRFGDREQLESNLYEFRIYPVEFDLIREGRKKKKENVEK